MESFLPTSLTTNLQAVVITPVAVSPIDSVTVFQQNTVKRQFKDRLKRLAVLDNIDSDRSEKKKYKKI